MIIDTNHLTTRKLNCLADAGVKSIIRYYARFTQQREKRLTRPEAEAILRSGMSIAMVHQAAGDSPRAFSRETGIADAEYARNQAINVIGQPGGSAIYFGVDFDCDEDDVSHRIVPYFRAVREILAAEGLEPRYEVGAYGNGLLLRTLLEANLVSHTWLSQSTGHNGSRAFKQTNRWTLFQHLSSVICGLDLDVDDFNPQMAGFGDFRALVPVGVPASGGSTTPQRFIVNARDGLRLRAGPGTEFEVLRVLAANTEVSVVSRSGVWAMIDLDGDRLVDGAVHGAFLTAA
jgi:hypothetical protein